MEITEEVEREVEEIDEETGEIKITTIKEAIAVGHTEQEVLDDDGNPIYEGMLGVLAVYDDGSCQVNGFCKVSNGEIATAADGEYMLEKGRIVRGYRVIERVTENIVKVVFR